MTYRVVIFPPAEREITETHRWLSARSPSAADKWVAGLRRKIATLARLPRRHPIAPESEAIDAEVRQLLYGKRGGVYRIVYAIQGDTVAVLAVRHAARGSPGI